MARHPRLQFLFVLCVAACGKQPSVRLADASVLTATTAVGTAPMFAVSSTGQRAVAWVSAPQGGTDGRLYVSVDGALPTELRDSLGPIEAHGEAPPKLAFAQGAAGTLYAVYTVGKVVPGERFPLSALRLVQTADGGRTWSAPVTVTDGPVFGAHSYHALHVASDGSIYVSWLGNKASWISRSTDSGRTWFPSVRVDLGEACPCCRTSVVSAPDGTLYMAWRHVYPGSIRDVVVARSTDHGATWSPPVRVHADDWHFDACPHAGPALAVDAKGVVHITWWSGKEGDAGVFYARSTDGARTFTSPIALGVARYSRPAHVQLAIAPPSRVVVAWDDGTTKVPRVLIRASSDGGAHFQQAVPVSTGSDAATFPVLGIVGDSLTIAWSQGAPEPPMQNHDRMAPQGLHAVGDTRVMVRRGVFADAPATTVAEAGFQPLTVGAPVPDYATRSLDGAPLAVGGVEPPTVLTVWATWCASCRAEMAALDSLHQEFAPRGVRVIAVSVDDGDDAPVRSYVAGSHLSFAIGRDPAGTIEQSYAVEGVPTTFVIGRDGRLVWRHTGDISDTLPAARAAVRQAVDGPVRTGT